MSKTLLLCLDCGDSFYADISESDVSCPNCGHDNLDLDEADGEHDQFNSDAEADADVLGRLGHG
jgi:predicted  nucleic acid-binding Zn-ribbon protein